MSVTVPVPVHVDVVVVLFIHEKRWWEKPSKFKKLKEYHDVALTLHKHIEEVLASIELNIQWDDSS